MFKKDKEDKEELFEEFFEELEEDFDEFGFMDKKKTKRVFIAS